MVRRRRNQGHTRRCITQLGDFDGNLKARKLTTFARFCTLGDLDLNFFAVIKVFSRHAKAARGNLFDRGARIIAVRTGAETFTRFTTFAGVRFCTDPVHGNRKGLVGLGR